MDRQIVLKKQAAGQKTFVVTATKGSTGTVTFYVIADTTGDANILATKVLETVEAYAGYTLVSVEAVEGYTFAG